MVLANSADKHFVLFCTKEEYGCVVKAHLFFLIFLREPDCFNTNFSGVFPLNNPSISYRYTNENLDQNDCCQESLKSSCLTFLAHLKCVPLGPSGINGSYAVLCRKLRPFARMLPVLRDFLY